MKDEVKRVTAANVLSMDDIFEKACNTVQVSSYIVHLSLSFYVEHSIL